MVNGLKNTKDLLTYLEKRKARLIILTENVKLNVASRVSKHRMVQKVISDVVEEFNVEFERIAPSTYVTSKRYTLSKLMKVAVYLISKLPNVQLYLARSTKKGKKTFISERGKTESVKLGRLLVITYGAGENLAKDKVRRKLAIEKVFKELAERGIVFKDIQSSVKITESKHAISRLIEIASELESKIVGVKCFIVAKIPKSWLLMFMNDEHVSEILTKVISREYEVTFTEFEIEVAKKLLELLEKDKSWRKAVSKKLNDLKISTLEALEMLLKKILSF